MFVQKATLLHVAPELCLSKYFQALVNITYMPIDLYHAGPSTQKMDITHMPLPNNSVDIVICNHVLEHVSNDTMALSEFYRVLKTGGWAIFTVPIYKNLEKTFEDPRIVTTQDRIKYFGQWDHLRKYGLDFPNRLRRAGFYVQEFPLRALSPSIRKKHALLGYDNEIDHDAARGADIFYCEKRETLP